MNTKNSFKQGTILIKEKSKKITFFIFFSILLNGKHPKEAIMKNTEIFTIKVPNEKGGSEEYKCYITDKVKNILEKNNLKANKVFAKLIKNIRCIPEERFVYMDQELGLTVQMVYKENNILIENVKVSNYEITNGKLRKIVRTNNIVLKEVNELEKKRMEKDREKKKI